MSEAPAYIHGEKVERPIVEGSWVVTPRGLQALVIRIFRTTTNRAQVRYDHSGFAVDVSLPLALLKLSAVQPDGPYAMPVKKNRSHRVSAHAACQ